jgi:hypothetical protein
MAGRTKRKLTMKELTRLEPRLALLLAEARRWRRSRDPHFCANAVFYGYDGHQPGLKERLLDLVGWESGRTGLLGSSTAYDVAYDAVYNVLPACRNCGCF